MGREGAYWWAGIRTDRSGEDDLAGREKWCPCLTNLAEMVNVLGLVVLGAEFGGGAWFIRTNSQGGTYPSLGTVL